MPTKRTRDTEALATLIQELTSKYRGLDILTSINSNIFCVSSLTVPKRKRNKGIGTRVIRALTRFSDQHKLTMTVLPYSPDSDLNRLFAFYKRFGFKTTTSPYGPYMKRFPK